MSSAPAISTDLRWLLGLLQASDSFYPTGAYAHSFGLEGMVEAGVVRDREGLRRFLRTSVLPTLRQVELPLVAHAWEAFGREDWPKVQALCELSSAVRAPREARAASAAIGRQRVDLLSQVHASPLATAYVARASAGGWPPAAPVAAALEARVHGAPLEAALAAACYAALAGVVAAAMKVLRLGQNAAQALLTEALALCPALAAAAPEVALDDIGWFNPWLDVAACRHETAATRLFIS